MDGNISARIAKDITLFERNVKALSVDNPKAVKVAELSRMYAKDAQSYLDKKDFYTAFSCISYAHGLLDALSGLQDG